MTTRNWRSSERGIRFVLAAWAGGMLGMSAGCATVVQDLAPGKARVTADHTFTFIFQNVGGTCTISAGPVVTPTPCPPAHTTCVRASRGKGETIGFASSPPTKFEVIFDPFKKGSFPIDGEGMIRLDKDAPVLPAGKAYAFSVVAPGCAPLDPWIIVQP